MRLPRPAPTGVLLAGILAAACGSDPRSDAPLALDAASSLRGASGAVVVATNTTGGNALLVFPRQHDGSLGTAVAFPTGGLGTGGGLGNQGGVTLAGNRWILAVNAASNDVSVFSREGGQLTLTDREASGGEQPVSVAAWGRLVYVLNAGGAGNIAGFRLRQGGDLVPISGSVRPLSATSPGPAQIGFAPDGRHLVVTEKATNTITLYDVGPDGVAGQPQPSPSAGETPFGFAFDPRGHLLVSEAFGGAADASALSSYRIDRRDRLVTLSGSVATTETAACWVAVSPGGRYAYVTNTGSNTVSGFRVHPWGRLSLLDPDGVTSRTGSGPIDLAFAGGGRLLYTLNGGSHSISGFEVRPDGGLSALSSAGEVPLGANGMVAW
jgi:6-phosphogluconolactonase (cycloisomerase 2 family)